MAHGWVEKLQGLIEAGQGEARYGRLLVGRWVRPGHLLLNPFIPRSVSAESHFKAVTETSFGCHLVYVLEGEGMEEIAWARDRLYPGFPVVYGVVLARGGTGQEWARPRWHGPGVLDFWPNVPGARCALGGYTLTGADLGRAPAGLWERSQEEVRAWAEAVVARRQGVQWTARELQAVLLRTRAKSRTAGRLLRVTQDILGEPDTLRAERKLRWLLRHLPTVAMVELLGV